MVYLFYPSLLYDFLYENGGNFVGSPYFVEVT